MRKKVENGDWGTYSAVELRCMPAERSATKSFLAYCSQAVLSRYITDYQAVPWMEGRWDTALSIMYLDSAVAADRIRDIMLDYARLTVDEYGYFYEMMRHKGPYMYFLGGTIGGFHPPREGDGRSDEQIGNIGAWTRGEHFRYPLLRDIYPYSFFNRAYLDRPVFDTTLEKWILADSARGTLEPLTGTITTWRPVVGNIPAIREELYRAGILFYYRHFDTTDPLYRDFSRPWVPPREVPEVFRESFYRGLDPRLTQ